MLNNSVLHIAISGESSLSLAFTTNKNTRYMLTPKRVSHAGIIGRTDPAAAFAARLIDTGNALKASGFAEGSEPGAGAPWPAVASVTDFINCGGKYLATMGDVVEEEGDVVGAVLGVSSSGDSLLRVLLGVSSSGVSFGCLVEDSFGVLEGVFPGGDSVEPFLIALEVFFVGDSSGASVVMSTGCAGAVAAFGADAVNADASTADADVADATDPANAADESIRGRGGGGFCTIAASDSFPMASRYSCEATRDGESEESATRHQTRQGTWRKRYNSSN